MTIQVLLADDHNIVRDGLRVLIERCHDMKVIAEAEDGRKALQLVRKHKPDIVIMDISMPGLERHRRYAPNFERGAGREGDRPVHALG